MSADTGSRTASRVRDEFVELICNDDELVRAEFDAIVAASWDTAPPAGRPPAVPFPASRPPGWPVPSARDLAPVPPGRSQRLARRWNRQRSPPGHRVGT